MTNEERNVVDRRAASRMGEEAAVRGDGGGEAAPSAEPGAGMDMAAQLEAERAKAEQYHRNWQRSAADFINYKKRVEGERGEQARFASVALVINILPVFDDLDRAVESVDSRLAGLNWVQGIVAIQRKFATLLEAMGVREIPASGEAFDPAQHEAVSHQPGPENRVIGVVQKGYTLHEKVIRPAMVIVGNGEEQ